MYDVSIVIILPYLDIPLVRVLDIIQAHVVAEPPVVLLAVEDVPNLPGELGPLPLVNDPEVRIGVARPSAALRLSIALEEVSNTLGVAVLQVVGQRWPGNTKNYLDPQMQLSFTDLVSTHVFIPVQPEQRVAVHMPEQTQTLSHFEIISSENS
jgi:hypothetical protein